MTTDPANTPARHDQWRIFPAAAIIVIGVLFLAGNLGYRLDFLYFHNWWAWIILLAALAPLSRAYESYRASGNLDGCTIRHLTGAAFMVLVAGMFLLDLDWAVWWPLFVILAGVAMLVRRPYFRYRPHGRSADDDATIRH